MGMTDTNTASAAAARFTKKPVTITASQWFKPGDHPMVEQYDPEKAGAYIKGPGPYGWIKTLEGGHIVSPGDWIITGVAGEHYPCKPDIFAATYSRAALATAPAPQPDTQDAERWMELGQAIEQACMTLPEGVEVAMSFEQDAWKVKWFDENGNEHDTESHESGVASVMNDAIDTAIAAQGENKNMSERAFHTTGYITPAQPDNSMGEFIGAFDAAFAEGLSERLAETTDERLKDLIERRLLAGYEIAIGAVTVPRTHPDTGEPEPVPVANLHPKTADLVRRFATALAEKLAEAEKKYGYSDGWASPDWMGECRLTLREHLLKGDPRDVAAYCAFLWHHGDSTALPIEEAEQLFRTPEPTQADTLQNLIALTEELGLYPHPATGEPMGTDAQEATAWKLAAENLERENVALRDALKKANSQAEHFEREWYLRGDALEAFAGTAHSEEYAELRIVRVTNNLGVADWVTVEDAKAFADATHALRTGGGK